MDAWTQTHQSMRICAVGALVGLFLSGVSAPACASWDGGIAGCFDSFQTAMETVCAINNPDSTSIPGYVYYRDKCVMTSTPNFVIYAHRVILSTGESVSFAYTSSLTQCAFTISLSGGTEVEPSNGADIKTLPFIATIKDQNKQLVTNPITVNVSVKVEDPKSGGHEHGDSTRPRGGIANVGNCESDGECWWDQTNNGAVVFNFNAPEASGTHTITATCEGCSNPATKQVNVKVAGLEKIPEISYLYTIKLPNRDTNHPATYFLTKASAEKLRMIALYYYAFTFAKKKQGIAPDFVLNDASLEWGGVLDCFLTCNSAQYPSTPWHKYHVEHRRGTVVDIKANGDPGSIVYADVFKKFARKYRVNVGNLHGGGSGLHYHIRLNNNQAE